MSDTLRPTGTGFLESISLVHKDRRERIATAVLAGFAANPRNANGVDEDVRDAVEFADALIAELDK